MEKHLTPSEASALDKILSLVRKAAIASKTSNFTDVDVQMYGGDHDFSFRFYAKGGTKPLLTISIRAFSGDFEENYTTLNFKLTNLIKTGIINY